MQRLQCHYCKRWLETDAKTVEYYATANHPVICGRCVNESEKYMRENFRGHTFVTRTDQYICIDKY